MPIYRVFPHHLCSLRSQHLTPYPDPNHPSQTRQVNSMLLPHLFARLMFPFPLPLFHSMSLVPVYNVSSPSIISCILTLSQFKHRPIQPTTSTTRSNAVTGPTFSLADSLDSIKQEYQSLHTELIKVRSERDELELKRGSSSSTSATTPHHLPRVQWSLK